MKSKIRKGLNYLKENWFNIVVIFLLIFIILGNLNQTIPSSFSKEASFYQSTGRVGMDYSLKNTGISYNENSEYKVKRASLTIESFNYDLSKKNILEEISIYNGEISRESETKMYNDLRTLSLEVKIPSNNLEAFLDNIKKKEGENIESLNVNSFDVSEQKQDYTERINRYKTQIEKYKEMLNKKDLKIEDEIKIQQRIDQLENQIYYLEKSNDNLDERINYSIVNIYLKEKTNPIKEVKLTTFSEYVSMFLVSLQNGLEIGVKLIAYILEIILLIMFIKLIKNGSKLINKK